MGDPNERGPHGREGKLRLHDCGCTTLWDWRAWRSVVVGRCAIHAVRAGSQEGES